MIQNTASVATPVHAIGVSVCTCVYAYANSAAATALRLAQAISALRSRRATVRAARIAAKNDATKRSRSCATHDSGGVAYASRASGLQPNAIRNATMTA